jgi:hypothetical protein
MAFVRWNQLTNIWEVAATPENPSTAWNHLPIGTPTLPGDTVNKAYVDGLIGGGGFVPYNGATANVNLGNFTLFSTRVVSKNLANANGPTLGSNNGVNLFVLDPGSLYGMLVGNSNSGDSWVQVQRLDGLTTTYNLLLQPAGGKVGVGYPDATSQYQYAKLNISSGGDPWTSSTWSRGIQLALGSVIKWGVYNYAWGIGASGDSLYFMNSNGEGTGTPVNYTFRLDGGPNGNAVFAGNITLAGAIVSYNYTNFMGFWSAFTPAWKTYGGTADGVIGDGLLAGKFTVIGKTVHYYIEFVVGTTTVFPASYWAFTLPSGFPLQLYNVNGVVNMATGGLYMTGSAIPGNYHYGVANSVGIQSPSPSSPSNGLVAQGFPWTWTTGMRMWITGTYETV